MANLISVIVPVYNVKKYLQQIVSDLEKQTFQQFELLLIDDGSTDGSGELCDSICKSSQLIIRVVHQNNEGLSAARNKGIQCADGDYLTFIDPDDRVSDNFLSYLVELINKSGCLMSVCSHVIVRGRKRKLGVNNSTSYAVISSQKFIEGLMYHQRFDTSAWAKMYHKSLFNDVSFPVGKLYEDLATIYKLAIRAHQICVGNEANYFYLIRDQSITNSTFSEQQLDFIEITDQMKTTIDDLFPYLADATAERLVFAYISTLTKTFNSVQDGKLKKIQQDLVEFIVNNKRDILSNNKSSLRDKLSVYLLMFIRLNGFRLFWQCYEHIRRLV